MKIRWIAAPPTVQINRLMSGDNQTCLRQRVDGGEDRRLMKLNIVIMVLIITIIALLNFNGNDAVHKQAAGMQTTDGRVDRMVLVTHFHHKCILVLCGTVRSHLDKSFWKCIFGVCDLLFWDSEAWFVS